MLPFRRTRTQVSPHEAVLFYPSYGYRTGPAAWSVLVQGCVYDQRVTWIRRKPVMAVLRQAMRVTHERDEFFRRRMRQFLVTVSHGRVVDVVLDGRTSSLPPTEPAGLFRGEVSLACPALPPSPAPRWIDFTAALPEGDDRRFHGTAQLLEPEGLSVISDVDDTLKHSNVPDRRDLFRNTFVRDFVPIPGMPELYRDCAARHAAFHYVSGSPWQLYEPLAEFWHEQGYPRGSFHLKRFRLRESARKLRRSPQMAYKRVTIEPILQAFPRRRFILIGDSGEQDPEIYAHFLRTRPEQIRHVFIRTVRGQAVDHPRLAATFADLPADQWTGYDTAEQIGERLLAMMTV